ncbi:MAG: hypothetical protein ABSB83_06630 [Methanomassiliicoccales archaeon]
MESGKSRNMFAVPGFTWRLSATIMLGVIWLSFLILWLFFWAGDFDVYQNLAIFIVSLLAAGGISGVIWGTVGRRMRW